MDAAGRYAGMVMVPEAHAADGLRHRETFLTPEMNAKEASAASDRSESEALAVIDGLGDRRAIGMLTESHTLKRYSDALDRRRRAMQGESARVSAHGR